MRRERKRKALLALWTLAFAAVALGALWLFARLERTAAPAWQGGYSVHLSEVMTDNTSCPSAEGLLYDWVEIENTTGRDFDLGGYYLTDDPEVGKYCFPAGSVVPARGYLVVWCSPDAEGEEYAPFGLRKEGGETLALLNKNLVAVDRAETVKTTAGQSLVRASDGSLVPADAPSPGYPNDEAGARAWQEEVSRRSGATLALSEIMSSNSLYAAPDGTRCDWVEVYNPNDQPVPLAGYQLSDREEKTKFRFPDQGVLAPGEYRVIWCAPGGTGDWTASFGVSSKGGETVVLTGPTGTVADKVEVPALEKNTSYIRSGEGWIVSGAPTPGYPNDEAGQAAYRASLGYEETTVYITEVMAHNKACCLDEDGDFSDWIELGNLGPESVELTGWYLSDLEETPDNWAIPSLTLGSGEYVRIWASGKNRTAGPALHTNFSLTTGETVCLSTPTGVVMRSVSVGEDDTGRSLALGPDGAVALSDTPTPGYPNDAAGYAAFCETDTRTSPLLIWEAVVSDPDHDDWVEIKNVSGEYVDLSGYTITDAKSDPGRMALPGRTLAPGELAVVECAGFGLNIERDEIYLFAPDGTVCDFARLHDIPLSGSFGRLEGQNGFFYFASKTPGAANGQGYRLVATAPAPDVEPGVYDGVESLTVAFSGENIHYTTDGSVPTAASPLYTGPVTLTKTTVIRAVSVAEGQLSAKPATYSYFINENSSLPVVSLVAAPDDLFGGRGIYTNHEQAWAEDWEREANISFYEDGGSFSLDCGIQIHGRTSRRASEKRSFKLKFRGRYGGDLHYDVFGDGVVTDFSSLLLRGSLEDSYTSYMRDELFASLAMDYTDVPAQNYRYVSLYINGEYWGIYAIREHHNKDYFAAHYGVDPETVDRQTGEFRNPGPWGDLMTYAENNPGCWDYMKERVDIPVMIDWLILECWSGDIDVYENVRFYASSQYENGKYLYALVDMDLTMMGHDTYSVGFNTIGQVHGIIPMALLSNGEFRDMFLTRLGELLQGGLSTQSVTDRLNELRAIVEPEAARDLARWGKDPGTFNTQMNNLFSFTAGRTGEMVSGARGYFGLNDEQMRQYFGSLAG